VSAGKLGKALLWAAPALVAGACVFLGSAHGAFVYDDTRQIVRNTLIQDPGRVVEALTSDVWAFKGGAQAVSNYWRPTFVAWLIANVRLFGLGDTFGWHLATILLHVLSVGLLWLVARRYGLAPPVATAVALLFAVHPVHVESVAWISGAPDPLLAVGLLGSLVVLAPLVAGGEGRVRGARRIGRWAAALGLYALALGAKEVALLFPAVVAAAALPPVAEGAGRRNRWLRAARITAPFALLAAAAFAGRWAVLGRAVRPWSGGADLASALATAPAAFVFYLRHCFLPAGLGPSYPLRAVRHLTAGAFWLPLVVSIAALAAAWWLARRSPAGRVGFALWLAPLAPAFAFTAFQPEQLVHDRYLYLPLAGLLLLVLPAAARGLERAGLAPARAPLVLLALAVVAAVPLSWQSWRYSLAWRSEVELWQRGVLSDPTSAFNHLELGAALETTRRFDEARAALDRSIELAPSPLAYVARARVELGQGRFEDAERDLGVVLGSGGADPYTSYQACEALAIAYERQRRLDRAAQVLVAARRSLPMYSAALTDKLAIVLHEAGRRSEALAELQSQRDRARSETLPESRLVLFHLGLLEAELGHDAEARAAFGDYLRSTAGLDDPMTRRTRAGVERALAKAPPPASP
jgi:tetratricopeptide (TPR) repeat protein